MDLTLVPMEELLREVETRCSTIVLAAKLIGVDEEDSLRFFYGKGEWSTAVGLAGILHNDVLNNWSGELRSLQQIHAEMKEEE